MSTVMKIPFTLREIENTIEVVYKKNDSAIESGFDILNVPFDLDFCLGYPVMHAKINMVSTGYRRYCGWVQLVMREYFSSETLSKPDENILSIDTNDPASIYLAIGSPPELYDAPCYNLNENVKGKWTAYTYLVDVPSRMNNHKMSCLAGFQWGYEEAIKNGNLLVSMQEIIEIGQPEWEKHIPCLKETYPQYEYI